MANNSSPVATPVEAGERFAQLVRAGLPFNPLAHGEIAGRNVKRLQEAMKVLSWSDPRFVAPDQVQALGWQISAGAIRVHTLVRDEASGEVNTVALYNAADVQGMPSIDSFIAMSSDELASLRARADGNPRGSAAIDTARHEPVEVSLSEGEEEFSIGPARSQMRAVLDARARQADEMKTGTLAAKAPAVAEIALPVPRAQASQNAMATDVKLDKKPAVERFAILAPYWLDGLHNTEGLALADEINKTIAAHNLAEDRAAVDRLLDVQEAAHRFGLTVVPEDLQRDDPSIRTNPAQPRTLLGGALVRDGAGAYRPAAGGRPVLQDKGDSVSLKSKSAEGYQAAMELAIAKGWTAIELKGRPAMLADAWLEAKLKGLDVVNYSPTKKDIEKYGARVAEEKMRAQTAIAPMESTPEMVEVRPFIDAEGHAKTATVVYTVTQTGAKPQPFQSARDAAATYAAIPASANPVVIRTVTQIEGQASREDVIAAVRDTKSDTPANAIGTALDEEFELAMKDLIAEQHALASVVQDKTPDTATRHIGQILGIVDGRLSQSVGRGNVVWHDIDNLEGPLPSIGEIADIQYTKGVGHVRVPEQQQGLGASLDR